MEDSFAHYKTERERTGDWWEPANVFSGNFYLIILLKLRIFCRCNGFRFCLSGALKAIGLTGKLMEQGLNLLHLH
jgi:hypothetical protein